MANQAEVGMKVATIEKLRREKEAVAADRLAQYPDATKGHTNLGLAWTGLLQNHYGIKLDHPIPAHVVLLMLGANKHNRAVLPTPKVHFARHLLWRGTMIKGFFGINIAVRDLNEAIPKFEGGLESDLPQTRPLGPGPLGNRKFGLLALADLPVFSGGSHGDSPGHRSLREASP